MSASLLVKKALTVFRAAEAPEGVFIGEDIRNFVGLGRMLHDRTKFHLADAHCLHWLIMYMVSDGVGSNHSGCIIKSGIRCEVRV